MRFSLALAHHADADDLATVFLNDSRGFFKGLGPVGQAKVQTGTGLQYSHEFNEGGQNIRRGQDPDQFPFIQDGQPPILSGR